MATIRGPKVVRNGLIRMVDVSQYGGWGIPEKYDQTSGGFFRAINPKNISGIGQSTYYNLEGINPSLFTINGIRCFATTNGDPRTPSGSLSYLRSSQSFNTGITGNSNRTFEMWLYLVSNTGMTDPFGYPNVINFSLMGIGAASAWNLFGFGVRSDTQIIVFGWNAESNYVRSSTFSSILNRWVLVAASNNGNNISFYLNGESVGTGSAAINTSDSGDSIIDRGLLYVTPYAFFSTTRIYNRQLSAAEMKQNFNAQRGRFGI